MTEEKPTITLTINESIEVECSHAKIKYPPPTNIMFWHLGRPGKIYLTFYPVKDNIGEITVDFVRPRLATENFYDSLTVEGDFSIENV